MAMVFGVAGTLSMHDTTANVDLPAFLNSTLAQVLGIFAAALVTRLVRTVGADWSARRIRRATWSELGAMAAAPRGAGVDEAYAVRMVDRIALLAPRVVQADPVVRNDGACSPHFVRYGSRIRLGSLGRRCRRYEVLAACPDHTRQCRQSGAGLGIPYR